MEALPPPPEGCAPVHCAACLQAGERRAAVWKSRAGYLLCDEHKDVDPVAAKLWRPKPA